MIGQTISQYRILSKLGEGGMGVVYKAYDAKLKRPVALKFLAPHLLADDRQRKRFVREAQAAAGLIHHHICTVHEVHEADGHTFMVMEYIEGESLKERIETRPLEIREALDIAMQVGKGLSKAHGQGIVHRDIKPANVLLTAEGDAKIVDFGLAKLAAQTKLTKTGTTVGTLMYMSPEQVKGEAVDHRTDIWSLGVVLYEMLTGKTPFEGEVEAALVYSIMNQDPKPVTSSRKDVPVGLEEVVERALEKRPERRYATVDEFLAALEDQRDRITLGIKDRRYTALRRLRRRKRLGGGVAIVAVVGLAAILMQTIHTRSARIDSIAVIPLENLSADPEQEFMVDGLTVDLINSLSQISGFEKVTARASIIGYKGTNKPLDEIARELDVEALVAGTVQPMGDHVKVAVELVRAATGKILWSAPYEEDLRGVQTLSSKVARAVVQEIGIALTPQEETRLASVREVDPEAWDAYLRGRYLFTQMTLDDLRLSIDQFNHALEIDGDFALAYFGLADSWEILGQLDRTIPYGEGCAKAKEAAEKAVSLDDGLAEAHAKLADISVSCYGDLEGAQAGYKKALQLNPNSATAHLYYSQLLNIVGRHEDALDHVLQAQRLDPLNPFIGANIIWRYCFLGRYDDALDAYRRTVEIDPDNAVARWAVGGWVYCRQHKYQEALPFLEEAVELSDQAEDMRAYLGYCYGRMGRQAEAERILRDMQADSAGLYSMAILYAGLGMHARALDWLEKADVVTLVWIGIEPAFEELRSNPRFQNLCRRINIPGS